MSAPDYSELEAVNAELDDLAAGGEGSGDHLARLLAALRDWCREES